jgi:hypothetical protein
VVIEEHKLRVLHGLKREEGTGCSRKFHRKELHNLYSLSDIVKRLMKLRMMG